MLTVNVESEFDPGRLRQAIAHLEKAVEIDPSNQRYRRILGEALIAARRFDTAVEHLEAAYRQSGDPRTAYLVAYSFYRMGRVKDALPFVTKMRGDESVGFARADLLRGRILFDNKRYAEAANAFAEASMINPSSREPQWHRAKALIALADESDGDTTGFYRTALQILSSYEPTGQEEEEWRFLLGRVYLALQHPMQALMHLEQTRRLGGKERVLLLGIALFLQGSRELARSNLAEAAGDALMREKCARYLAEIAAASPDRLRAMGAPLSGASAPNQIDRAFLESVFGKNAPEVDSIANAATHWTEGQRTAAEQMTVGKGRLFAPLAQSGASTIKKSGDEAKKPKESSGPTPSGFHQKDDRAPTEAVPTDDRLKPRTFVDVGAVLSEEKTSGHEVPPIRDDTGVSAIATDRFAIDQNAPAPTEIANRPPTTITKTEPIVTPEIPRTEIATRPPSEIDTTSVKANPSLADTLAIDVTELDETMIETPKEIDRKNDGDRRS